eukprot:gene7395-18682_t
MMIFLAALTTALAPSSGGFSCGVGTVPDESTATCVVDPAILAQARTARQEPGGNEVDSEASIYIDDATSNLHIQSPPGGVVLVDGVEVAAGVTPDAFEARVAALEKMVVENKIAADAKVNALQTTLDAIDADLNAPIAMYCDMRDGGWTYPEKDAWFRIAFTGERFDVNVPDRSAENDETTRFHFKLYGAAAGVPWRNEDTPSRGGYGGSCEGSYVFDSNSEFYVYVGGKGGEGHREDQDHDDPNTYNFGGWNGGGKATRGGSGGGGGTDVRMKKADLSSRIIVAGGGGGCGYNGCERRGGDGDCVAYGGTQTEGGKNDRSAAAAYGSFGQGGTFIRENDGGGGGGGWYGGSGACYDNTPGGGGSSFYDKMESNAYRQMDQGGNDGEGYVVYRFL